jgi:hypothetical protein
MSSHEEFLELCAAATAGELSIAEQARLDAHLVVCPECRRAKTEYETAAVKAMAFAADRDSKRADVGDDSWSVENAEAELFQRLDRTHADGQASHVRGDPPDKSKPGRRFTYRPSQIRWQELWMPFAAAVLLCLALGVAAYRTGIKRGTDVARTVPPSAKDSEISLEAQASDAGYERAQLLARISENGKVIADLRQQLSQEKKLVMGLNANAEPAESPATAGQQVVQAGGDSRIKRDEELKVAQTKLADLQTAIDAAAAARDDAASRATVLEAKVTELTDLLRDRDHALDRNEAEVAKQQELLEHDRDIRDLMGARELYMADVYDVSGKGTAKTYGRVFYTKGKSLIFYAFDLDAQQSVQNASAFQAWGRRGPDKLQALNLGIFFEDNLSKKRWVLKANDPKALEDIDAVFVTVEPNGGSHHPSGKQLLFASLRITPNHP